MNLAITGASGFIGRNFLNRYGADFSAISVLSRKPQVKAGNHRVVPGELGNAAALSDLCLGADVVVHCAFDGTYSSNLSALRDLLRSCEKHGVKRLVHLSSYVVYDFAADPINETTAVAKRKDIYTREKIALERVLRTSKSSCSILVLQPTVVFGPGSAWANQMFLAAKHSHVKLPNAGKNICNAVYIDDLVDVMRQQIDAPIDNSIQTKLVSNIHTSWKSFLEFHAMALGKQGHPVNQYDCLPANSNRYAESRLKNLIFENSGLFPLRQVLPKLKKSNGDNGSGNISLPLVDAAFAFSGTARMCQSYSHRVEPKQALPPRSLGDWLVRFCSQL
jgi:nucleoside-diphosphate-sugar epimerase